MTTSIMTPVKISGCARRRAKAIARRERVTALTHRREDIAFYERGTIPPSSIGVSMCSCGARSFTRDESWDFSDFDEMHSGCEVVAS